MPLLSLFRRFDRALFILWTALTTLGSARVFYGYMLKQTGGEWSAPLDDVFIHFDYARATALGHPFEWTIGNGYSSGNTSLTYPFVLAVGWWLGLTGRALMKWAAIVAAMSVFGTILAARRLFIESVRDDAGRVISYLLPPAFVSVGALAWSLWSGMEVAFFLGTWAIALVAWIQLEDAEPTHQRAQKRRALWLGAAGALLVATRPEAALTIAIFGVAAAQAHRREGLRHTLAVLVRVAVPPALVLTLQAAINKALTGEASANGAIVKLAINHPFMTGDEKLADWTFNATYAALRNLDYHFASAEGDRLSEWIDAWPNAPRILTHLAKTAWWAGVIPVALAALPVCFRRTQRIAVVLWAQVVAWVLVVALNGQVRWQNERYVMPAVAWVLILAALGVAIAVRARASAFDATRTRRLRPSVVPTLIVGGLIAQTVAVLVREPGTPPDFRLPWLVALGCGVLLFTVLRWRPVRGILVAALVLFACDHQTPKMRDQKWFFGRASRNIRDQHLTLGRYLGELAPKRVLVGDAGAILYESNRPGLDIIGLGGYRKYPFARAGVHGLAATIELLERMPEAERPDVLAIFPTWWGILPTWFGKKVLRRFPVEGNVICGGYEHIVYEADWHWLNTGERLRWKPTSGESSVPTPRIRTVVDVADLMSEKNAHYTFSHPANGWTDLRVLPDPDEPRRDMLDGGRRIVPGHWEAFRARQLTRGQSLQLVLRTAQEASATVRVSIDGRDAGTLTLERTEGWQETAFSIRAEYVGAETVDVRLTNEGPGDLVNYHLWILQ